MMSPHLVFFAMWYLGPFNQEAYSGKFTVTSTSHVKWKPSFFISYTGTFWISLQALKKRGGEGGNQNDRSHEGNLDGFLSRAVVVNAPTLHSQSRQATDDEQPMRPELLVMPVSESRVAQS